jgi:hypothetical protein
MTAKGIDRLRNARINRHAFNLNDEAEVEAVIRQVVAAATKPKLLVIDTLARNFSGDENSTKEMSAFVNHCAAIGVDLQLAVLIVHHAGKDTAKGARGSIALTGAVDLSVELRKSEDGKTASVFCRKMKDAEEFAPYGIKAVPVENSIVLEHDCQWKNDSLRAVTVNDFLPELATLLGTEGLKVLEVATLTGEAESTARRHLELAVKHGYATKNDKPARYILTEKGKTAVDGWKLVYG